MELYKGEVKQFLRKKFNFLKKIQFIGGNSISPKKQHLNIWDEGLTKDIILELCSFYDEPMFLKPYVSQKIFINFSNVMKTYIERNYVIRLHVKLTI